MSVTPDRTFGNRGTLWSGMPAVYEDYFGAYESIHFVGGSTTGMQLLPNGSVSLVVAGWTYFPSPASPTVADEAARFTTVRLVVFPPDGTPQERLRFDGTRTYDISDTRRMALPVASCTTADGNVAVLVRQVPSPQNAGLPWEFLLYLVAPTGQRLSTRPVNGGWLHGELSAQGVDSVRMAPAGTDLGIASSNGTRVRVTVLTAAGAVPRDVDLAGSPALPGLARLDVASVRFEAGAASVALTAHLNHPGVGPTTVGAVLRLLPDGSRDVNFGENGLWASPLMMGYRDFVAAGEADGFLAGCIGRRAVVFGLGPSGSGLEPSFGDAGIAEHDLGGSLTDPVTATDGSGIYVLAQRAPSPAAGAGDFRTAGCRFHRAPGAPNHGGLDGAWGTGGTVTLGCDGAPVTPEAAASNGTQLFVGGTRQLHGADCDRIPVVVALATANGEPIVTFGAGAFALIGSVDHPALVMPDGGAVFVERSSGATTPALRFLTPAGEGGRLEPLTPVPAGSIVNTLTRLADGSLLVAGGGAEAWVAKLGPTGTIDTSFGAGGVVHPKPGSGQGDARVLGVHPDGDIALSVSSGGTRELAVMSPGGQMDSSYGTGGFLGVKGFTHPGSGGDAHCFLDTDGSVVCIASTGHTPADPFSSPVSVGLRRITPAGAYDPSFGLGQPSLQAPAPGQFRVLTNPIGTSPGHSDFSRITPVGMARLGTRLYVVATGWTGGAWIPGLNVIRPSYPLLLIMAWKPDGSPDPTFAASGRQEGGYDPEIAYWSAAGVIPESPTSFLVYGNAGEIEQVTTSVGGVSYPSIVRRQPQPALWRVEQPGGLDPVFGGDSLSTIRLQEFLLTSVAGALLSGGRVRVACVDALRQPLTDEPRVNVGGLVQWRPAKRRPGRPN